MDPIIDAGGAKKTRLSAILPWALKGESGLCATNAMAGTADAEACAVSGCANPTSSRWITFARALKRSKVEEIEEIRLAVRSDSQGLGLQLMCPQSLSSAH